MRQAILNAVCKWGNLFKQHLHDRVVNSLNDLDNFIREAVAAMQVIQRFANGPLVAACYFLGAID